jgi:cytoskeletal protein RodZ
MAAAPVNGWAARRAALPAWLRDRRRTEYRRDRRSFAVGVATGGAVAVLGVAIAAVALLFTGHAAQTPNLVGPAQGSPASSSPSQSPSSTPSATTSPSSSPSASPSSSPSTSPSPSPSPSASVSVSPSPSATTSTP